MSDFLFLDTEGHFAPVSHQTTGTSEIKVSEIVIKAPLGTARRGSARYPKGRSSIDVDPTSKQEEYRRSAPTYTCGVHAIVTRYRI